MVVDIRYKAYNDIAPFPTKPPLLPGGDSVLACMTPVTSSPFLPEAFSRLTWPEATRLKHFRSFSRALRKDKKKNKKTHAQFGVAEAAAGWRQSCVRRSAARSPADLLTVVVVIVASPRIPRLAPVPREVASPAP